MKTHYRFNEHYCGERYLDVSIVPEFCMPKGKRRKSQYKPSTEAQKKQNVTDRDRYICRLFNKNYTERDYYLTVTYGDSHLPDSFEAAEREINNYIRRIYRYARKNSITKPKVFKVTGYGERRKRLHHHLVISGNIPAHILKQLWKDKHSDLRGRITVDSLEIDPRFGLERLANYFMKHVNENRKNGIKHTYYRSRNLEEPTLKPRRYRMKKKEIVNMAEHTDFAVIERLYPGYILIRPEDYITEKDREKAVVFNKINGGYYFHFKLYKPPTKHSRKTRLRERKEII